MLGLATDLFMPILESFEAWDALVLTLKRLHSALSHANVTCCASDAQATSCAAAADGWAF